MADNGKAMINLTTGHQDADKVTVAFLVATAALAKERRVVMFLTKEAVRIGLPATPTRSSLRGRLRPPSCSTSSPRAAVSYTSARSASRRKLDGNALVANATLAGATPLWEFIGDGATVFSY